MGSFKKRNAHFSDLCCQTTKDTVNRCDANELLLCALKITPLGLWCWDIITNEIILSDEIFEITGADQILFDGSIEYIIQHIIHPTYQNIFRETIEKDLVNGKILTREYRINNPFKDECWVRINGQLTFDDNDIPIKYVGTILDITKDYLSHKQLKNELSFFEAMIEALPNPIFYKDFLGLYRYCNAAFLNYLGLTQDQILNKSVYDIAPKNLADIYHKADYDLMISQGSQVYETNVKYSDGTLHDVIFSKAAHVDDHQHTIGLVGIMQDITDKKAVENQVKMLHQVKDAFLEINHVIMSFENELGLLESLLIKLKAIFDVCEQCSVLEITDENYLKIVVSSGFDKEEAARFSIPIAESFIWTDLNGVFKEAHIVNNIEDYIENNAVSVVATESNKIMQSTLIVPIRINNKVKWIFSFDSHINHAYTELHRVVANFIGEELPLLYRIFELHQKNLQLSRYDGLTGLMTRSYFDYVFEDRLAVSQRHQYELLVVVFDLDGLKKINDYYGHLAGDHYITTFATLVKEYYRKSDTFSRVGGDEFVGLFSSTTAEALNQKICTMRQEFEKIEIQAELGTFNGSFSFGIAHFPNDSEDKSKLMQIADANMYKDKIRKK